ncbi:hypothetical protein V490_02316 [Pseudogymnoascus sp. VKM F-3557]|nr:hypothetical protein V490_02316 [Pseudogymnoascus sp. VKM F-3557]
MLGTYLYNADQLIAGSVVVVLSDKSREAYTGNMGKTGKRRGGVGVAFSNNDKRNSSERTTVPRSTPQSHPASAERGDDPEICIFTEIVITEGRRYQRIATEGPGLAR